MDAKCPESIHAAAFIGDELSQRELARFKEHLDKCECCRAEVRSTRALIFRMQSAPKAEVSRDLAASILARARAEEAPAASKPAHRRWKDVAAIAALAAFFAGGAWYKNRPLPGEAARPTAIVDANSASASRALDWFCSTQEADGSWNAEKWGGNRRFEIALTALPLLALLDGEATPERSTAIAKAAAYVERQQNSDGTFGQAFRESPYIHSVSTLALLRVYERTKDATMRPALHAAMRVVFATQTADGGWGYGLGTASNEAITLWHRDVVELAAKLGWEQAGYSRDLAQAWLRTHESTGSDLARRVKNDPDFHHAYFAVEALRREKTRDAERTLADIRGQLVARQAEEGATAGTWTPTDQWGRAGGRIYSTALASLALR